MNKKTKIALTLIGLGLIGFALPIIPGILFFTCGILLLVGNKYGNKLYNKIKKKGEPNDRPKKVHARIHAQILQNT